MRVRDTRDCIEQRLHTLLFRLPLPVHLELHESRPPVTTDELSAGGCERGTDAMRCSRRLHGTDHLCDRLTPIAPKNRSVSAYLHEHLLGRAVLEAGSVENPLGRARLATCLLSLR